MSETYSLRRVARGIDLHTLRYIADGEPAARLSRAVPQMYRGENEPRRDEPAKLIWRESRLYFTDEAFLPQYPRIALAIREIFSLTIGLEINVTPSAEFFVANQLDQSRTLLRIAFSSALIDTLPTLESMFLIGTQLPLAVFPSLQNSAQRPTTEKGERIEQLTADRIGLLCCQSLQAAHNAMMLQATGLTRPEIAFVGFEPKSAALENKSSPWEANALTFLRFRLQELAEFAESNLYRAALGLEDLTLTESPILIPIQGRMRQSPEAQVAAEPQAEVDSDALSSQFVASASLWLAQKKETLNEEEREMLNECCELATGDVPEDLDEFIAQAAAAESWRKIGAKLATHDAESRRDAMRSVLSFLAQSPSESRGLRPQLAPLFEALGISSNDKSVLEAEFLDPEFANYPFVIDEAVEVLLDGEWVPGLVRERKSTGDIRVLLQDDSLLRLNPLSDLIRPQQIREAS